LLESPAQSLAKKPKFGICLAIIISKHSSLFYAMIHVVMLGLWPDEEMTGGVASHYKNLVLTLSRFSNIKITIISFHNKDNTTNYDGYSVVQMKRSKLFFIFPPLAIVRIWLEVAKLKPDVIHIHGCHPSPYTLFGIITKRKTIYTYHSYPSREYIGAGIIMENGLKHMFVRFVEKTITKKANAIIAVDNRIKEWVISEFGYRFSKKIFVILNGVDVKKFDIHSLDAAEVESFRNRLGISSQEKVVFNAKAFVPKNGQIFLIEAMKKILDEKPSSWLILGGNGPMREKFDELIVDLKISERVVFPGNIPNSMMPLYLAASDIVVIPSISIAGLEEASSIFQVEAMAMSKPVIATNIGGLKETIENGKNGILISDKNPESIAESSLRLMNDVSMAQTLGDNARKYVEENRTWERVAIDVIQIYRQVIQENRG